MSGEICARGMRIVETPDDADVVIVNTCGFIQPAKEEAIDVILALAEEKKHRPFKLVVAGCLAQRYAKTLLSDLPEVDLFIGVGEVGRIADHLTRLNSLPLQSKAVITKPEFLMTAKHRRMLSSESATAYLKISDGCSNHCAYCAIPSIRGRARSRTPDDILKEATMLIRRGVKEIILIGQDTTAYGYDLKNRPTLAALLGDLSALPGLSWLRVLYMHPAHLSVEVLDAMARHPKICRYIDLPVQHADDTILAAMNRHVTAARLSELIALARKIMPDVAIRTSIIVGFPGETAKRFERLLDFVRRARFDHLGVFVYSREEGTQAFSVPSRISEKEKERRRDAVMNEQAEISRSINAALIGTVQDVIVEERCPQAGYDFIGRCRRQAPEIDGVTYIQGKTVQIGQIVACKIISADHYDLYAECVEPPRVGKS